VRVVRGWAERAQGSMIFTFAPSTPLLMAMFTAGRLFPRGDRSPAIVPVAEARLRRMVGADPGLARWQAGRTQRISSGFYTSQAFELGAQAR
jgi:magnesium-protoporphyrin O-methyltransferase